MYESHSSYEIIGILLLMHFYILLVLIITITHKINQLTYCYEVICTHIFFYP